jgi:hypothetical protein
MHVRVEADGGDEVVRVFVYGQARDVDVPGVVRGEDRAVARENGGITDDGTVAIASSTAIAVAGEVPIAIAIPIAAWSVVTGS